MKRLKPLKARTGRAGQGTRTFSEETLKYHQEGKKRQRPRKVPPGGGREHQERRKQAPKSACKLKFTKKGEDRVQKNRQKAASGAVSGGTAER